MNELLRLERVTRYFGGLAAVSGVDISVGKGELTGLIGPNGAGKTTVFNLLTGVYAPSEGRVLFDGGSLAGKRPCQVARSGISRTFQNIRLFGSLTVLQNVRVAASMRTRSGLVASLLRTGRQIEEDRLTEERCLRLLAELDLAGHAHARATALPYGLQRRVEIARAMATRPKLLLLDEPAAGMNPIEKAELMALIGRLRSEFDLTVLLIEHDMRVVMGICERIYVLDYGQVISVGTPEEVRSDPAVIAAYLGTEVAAC